MSMMKTEETPQTTRNHQVHKCLSPRQPIPGEPAGGALHVKTLPEEIHNKEGQLGEAMQGFDRKCTASAVLFRFISILKSKIS